MIATIKLFLKRYPIEVVLLAFTLLGFFYRINGLADNYSFWVDEASTARFGRGVVETGFPKIKTTGYYETAYYLTHYLTGFSFKIFGTSEFSARLPEVIFGTLVILAVFWLAKETFDKHVGLGASLFTVFSYIQIAWSRQARGYAILEFFFLMTLFFLWQFLHNQSRKSLLFLLICLTLSIFTHTLGIILIPIILFILVCFRREQLYSYSKFWLIIGVFFTMIGFSLLGWQKVVEFVWNRLRSLNFLKKNFVWYYHSLFWRQYSLFSFLSAIAVLSLFLKKKNKKAIFFSASILIYLFVVSFFLGVPFEKYALVVFPLLFILSSYALKKLAALLIEGEYYRKVVFFLLVAFIIINGNKFSWKSRHFYTLNFDMREIPEIDYKKIYQLAKDKSRGIDIKQVAFVDIDADAVAWYLGEGMSGFIPRKDVDSSVIFDKNRHYRIVHNLKEFKEVKNSYPYGFVLLIEHNYRFYPEGFVDYVRKNLRLEKREEFADFSPDWNRWPVEFYSWGFDDSKEK